MSTARFLGFPFLAFVILCGAYYFFVRAPEYPLARVNGVSLRLLLATSTAAQERGLGERSVLPRHEGMLFVFKTSDRYGFWMKDMRFPIDIIWMNAQGQVVTIEPSVATSTFPDVFYPAVPARYVLETTAGFARANNIATGTPIQLQNVPGVSE